MSVQQRVAERVKQVEELLAQVLPQADRVHKEMMAILTLKEAFERRVKDHQLAVLRLHFNLAGMSAYQQEEEWRQLEGEMPPLTLSVLPATEDAGSQTEVQATAGHQGGREEQEEPAAGEVQGAGAAALARLLLDWGASTGTSSLPITATSYPALNLAPTKTYSELEEEEKEELVAKQKEKVKRRKEKEVSDNKGDEVVKEKEVKTEGKIDKENEVTRKKEGRVKKGKEVTRKKKAKEKTTELEEEEEDKMVLRSSCEVCGERSATLREVEGLVVCLPCTQQQQTSYSTASSTGDATTRPTRRVKKSSQN